MDAVIVVAGGRPMCRKLRDVQGRRGDRLRPRRHPRHAGVPRARPARLRVHEQRRLVGAARRRQRRAHRRDDARGQEGRRPHRRRRRTGRRAHRRRRAFLRADSRAATCRSCSPATRWPCTTSSSRCRAPRSASISPPARPSSRGTAITWRRSTRSTAPAASARRSRAACSKSGVMYECVTHGVEFVLAGSIRDDGPLPDTVMDLIEAQERYAEALVEQRAARADAVVDAAQHRRRQHAAVVGARRLRRHQSRGRHEAERSRDRCRPSASSPTSGCSASLPRLAEASAIADGRFDARPRVVHLIVRSEPHASPTNHRRCVSDSRLRQALGHARRVSACSRPARVRGVPRQTNRARRRG